MDEQRSEAEWDLEIEAEFQRVVAGTKERGQRKRGQRFVGFPFAYMADVCRLTRGRAALAVAVLVYRRTYVVGTRTVTLPGEELAAVGVNREMKRRALAQLAAANLIRIERALPGRSAAVTLLWKPK